MSGWTTRSPRLARRRPTLSVHPLEVRDVPATGFLTTQAPYLVPVGPAVEVKPLVTVGDAVPKTGTTTAETYRMVGIPDGMGAFDNGDGTFTLLLSHELPADRGVVRAHGQKGAFVSKWVIDKATRTVLSGSDLITDVLQVTGTDVLGRLCSADLPSATAFFNAATGLGTQERIYMNGEEVGAEGRGFGTVVSTGVAFELPRLGKFSWENSVASPFAQDQTVVVGLDDSTPGQVYVYVGNKTNTGTDVDKAGLTNGSLFGIKVDSLPLESRDFGLSGAGPGLTRSARFSLHDFGDVSAKTGAQLQTDSVAAGVTEFLRPEDGQWDPNNPRDFYFVTTDRFDTATSPGRSRLYRLRFDDITDPAAGGTVEMLLDGTDPGQMYDNMTVDASGRIILQEDPGNQAHLARIWRYDIATGELATVAQHNPAYFIDADPATAGVQGARDLDPTTPGSQGTLDEESSGVIDLSAILGPGTYMVNVQAHLGLPDPELVEAGQLLILSTKTVAVNQGVLGIQGTPGDDVITVARKGKSFSVTVNGQTTTVPANQVTRLRIDGSAGNDTITVKGGVAVGSVITGGLGNDRISDGQGTSVLIGGEGLDSITGGAAGDLLVGGAVNMDEDGLRSLYRAWTSGRRYADRVRDVRDLLDGLVIDDGVKDVLKGQGALDAFWVGIEDDSNDTPFEYRN